MRKFTSFLPLLFRKHSELLHLKDVVSGTCQSGLGLTKIRKFSVNVTSISPPSSSIIDSWGPNVEKQSNKPEINEHLIQKFNSIEMLSANEKFDLELKKKREEFRIHESDCGSCEVQVALLTTKIKYLSSHLTTHKKDIHSRRGLQAMLSTRKKLLKYFRRTEWERYCALIERLGLRDTIETK